LLPESGINRVLVESRSVHCWFERARSPAPRPPRSQPRPTRISTHRPPIHRLPPVEESTAACSMD
jgi:hypothetical protein